MRREPLSSGLVRTPSRPSPQAGRLTRNALCRTVAVEGDGWQGVLPDSPTALPVVDIAPEVWTPAKSANDNAFSAMDVLIDTNILIPAEPTLAKRHRADDPCRDGAHAARLGDRGQGGDSPGCISGDRTRHEPWAAARCDERCSPSTHGLRRLPS